MRTVTIDSVEWRVELTGTSHRLGTPDMPPDIGVRYSRPREPRVRIGYISPDVPLEQVPDMILKVAFDEGAWQDEPAPEG